MANARAVLQAALAGGPVERTLLAPLVCAVAAEVEGLAPQAFLGSATKLANTLRDLQRGLGLDIVVPEAGAHLELEALGATLDWREYPPQVVSPAPAAGVPAGLERQGRLPILLDTLSRLRTVLGDRAAIAVAIGGPRRLAAASGGVLSFGAAAELALATVRLLCARGVELVWLLEDGSDPPADPEGYADLTAPIWGTIRFYQAVPALHLPGAADGWAPVLAHLAGAVVPCVDPVCSPALSAVVPAAGPYGAIVPAAVAVAGSVVHSFLRGPGCLLLTTDRDLYGHVSARDLASFLADLRRLISN